VEKYLLVENCRKEFLLKICMLHGRSGPAVNENLTLTSASDFNKSILQILLLILPTQYNYKTKNGQ
jgi:hypothetical protein